MIERIIGGLAFAFLFIYSIVRAGMSGSDGQPDSDRIALELLVPNTIALAFIALLGYYLSQTIENDDQLALVFGTLFICSIWFSLSAALFSNIRQTQVA